MDKPLVSCLMATHGRYARVCEALACFLSQDYPNRELVILNNHPVPLEFAHPLVTILNEGGIHPTLGHCRNRLLAFASGEFVRTWDDDDLYLPYAISQGVERIGDAPAWKPARSWFINGLHCYLMANAMEASIIWRNSWVRKIGYYNGEGDEHRLLNGALGNAGPASEELGSWSSYAYRWGQGEWHCSGSLGDGRTDEERAADWQRHNHDVRPGVPLVPDFGGVHEWWRRMMRFVEPTLQTAWMKAALGQGPAHAPPVVPLPARGLHGRIIATPGCWDLLSSGHVDTLRWASEQGESLTVLVNDDAGVAAQKGPGRPLVPLAGRVASLQALPFVDAVLVVEGINDIPILNAISAVAVVKGPDYAARDLQRGHYAGGEVLIAPESPYNLHTSDLVELACVR